MTTNLRKPKILIVDDAMDNIQVIGTALQPEHQIFFALEAQEGLRSAIANSPDLILLDVLMPGMDGYEMCRRLKADEKTKNIPVIFITSRAGELDEAQGFEAGGVDYISKPFNVITSKARIKTHLELKKHTDFLEWMLKERSKELEEMEKEYMKLFNRV